MLFFINFMQNIFLMFPRSFILTPLKSIFLDRRRFESSAAIYFGDIGIFRLVIDLKIMKTHCNWLNFIISHRILLKNALNVESINENSA